MAQHPRTVLVVGAVVLGLAGVALVLIGPWRGSDQPLPPDDRPDDVEPEPEPEPEPAAWPLTGVRTDDVTSRPALIVKVSNSPEARPQTGLELADVVFEELVEGGVTRFAAVFHSRTPEVVGPVRSARPVDAQLLSGFGRPGFAYSGAREEVRELLARTAGVLLTEGDPGFFRDDGRYASTPVAPHDLFLTADETWEAALAGGAAPLGDLGWAFDDELPPTEAAGGDGGGGTGAGGADGDGGGGTGGDGTTVEIVMSDAFRTTWTYDPEAGVYRRAQNGVPSEVTGPGAIAAANVVVVRARHYRGASGFPETDVVGEGEAVVLRDGRRYAARWSKPSASDPLLVLTADGRAPFPFQRGTTWIHLPEDLPG
jgi:hypothetical protein